MTLPPLLLLAEGRKPRLRRAAVEHPKEISLHMEVAAFLRSHCRSDWLWTHIPSGEARDPATARKLRQMGLRAGWPDFVLISPDGRLHCLELKRQGETLSGPQESIRAWCDAHAVPFVVAKSMADVRAAFAAWRCLSDSVVTLLKSAR